MSLRGDFIHQGLMEHGQTVPNQIRGRTTWHLIRFCSVCLYILYSAGKEKHILASVRKKDKRYFFYFAEKQCEKDKIARNFAVFCGKYLCDRRLNINR